MQSLGADLFGEFLFGVIGFAAFMYGKKQAAWKPLTIGILLMAFPYFSPNTTALYIIGGLLSLALFF